MRIFCLVLLYGISFLGLSRHIFPSMCPANVQSVVTATVKMFLPFFFSVLIFNSIGILKVELQYKTF